jgi:hypothetical protein
VWVRVCCWCGWRYFAEKEAIGRRRWTCRCVVIIKRVIIKRDRGLHLIVRNSGNTAISKFGYDMILVQGPSCLFSAVIEKPFFSSSRQVTIIDARQSSSTRLVTHVFVYQTFSALSTFQSYTSAMKTPCPQEPNATGKGQYRWRGASK